MRVIFYTPWVFKILPEVWRLATPFLLTSNGLGFIFDLYFRASLPHLYWTPLFGNPRADESNSVDILQRS
jgi:hypothetical protein